MPSYIATSQVQLPVGRVYELWTNSRGPKGDSDHQILGISHFPQFQMTLCQWIGLRENLQETIDFPIQYGAFL